MPVHAERDVFADVTVQHREVDISHSGQRMASHATTDVYANDIRDDGITEFAGKADHTAGTCMSVRHNILQTALN